MARSIPHNLAIIGISLIVGGGAALWGYARADPSSEPTPLTITRIIDGDTFQTRSARVRIWGIDAPEMDTTEGRKAKAMLRHLLRDGRKPLCSFVEVGPYRRDIMRCDALACEMVATGWAQDWPRYSGGAYADCEG